MGGINSLQGPQLIRIYDDIIDQLLDTTTPTIAAEPATTVDSHVRIVINAKRERRLLALVAGEQAKQYLGRDLV